jgi:hypothetical protein
MLGNNFKLDRFTNISSAFDLIYMIDLLKYEIDIDRLDE